jgi:hypothetical protein
MPILDEALRTRLLYSLGDFQQALSAAAFLEDCDPDRPTSKNDLRRFKCYETTLVIAYLRPFSQAKGKIPRLMLENCGVSLSDDLRRLHDQLRLQRNRILAHSDGDLMRMAVATHEHKFDNGNSFTVFHSAFDEGISVLGSDLLKVRELIQTLYGGIFEQLYAEAQQDPTLYNLKIDYI